MNPEVDNDHHHAAASATSHQVTEWECLYWNPDLGPRTQEGPLPALDLLAVGAHPDDIEIACGGSLAQLARKGYRVGIVDLTDGEPTPLSPGPDVRLQEARRAAEILGISVRIVLNLPNRRLFDNFENRIALAKVFRRWRPKVVIGFGGKTVMASPDHYQAMLLTDAAVFYSRLTKWDEHFDGLPVHAISNQLAFPIALHTLNIELPQTTGIFVMDISDALETKLAAIAAYVTQFGQRPRVLEMIAASNRYHGLAAGYQAGEIFFTYHPLGTDDLLQWTSPKIFPPRAT